MKKLSSKEKAIIECYASKWASVDNCNYLKENAINNEDFQKRDTIFRKERSALWAMSDILECLNLYFHCKRVNLEKIVLSAYDTKNCNKLYDATVIFSSNGGWKVAD